MPHYSVLLRPFPQTGRPTHTPNGAAGTPGALRMLFSRGQAHPETEKEIPDVLRCLFPTAPSGMRLVPSPVGIDHSPGWTQVPEAFRAGYCQASGSASLGLGFWAPPVSSFLHPTPQGPHGPRNLPCMGRHAQKVTGGDKGKAGAGSRCRTARALVGSGCEGTERKSLSCVCVEGPPARLSWGHMHRVYVDPVGFVWREKHLRHWCSPCSQRLQKTQVQMRLSAGEPGSTRHGAGTPASPRAPRPFMVVAGAAKLPQALTSTHTCRRAHTYIHTHTRAHAPNSCAAKRLC